jgi:hypothetical protein
MSTRSPRPVVTTALLLWAAAAVPLQAQSARPGSTWLPFVGCWEAVGQEGEGAGLLCFRLAGGGVELTNVLEGEVQATERMVADGVERPVEAEGCSGTESVAFSDDGHRVFTSSSFTCTAGEERTGTGVMSFIAPGQWVDVRSLTVNGDPVAWVQRYAAATPESLGDHGVDDPMSVDPGGIRASRIRAAGEITVEDVEEAARRIDAEAVKAWVATNETPFELDGAEIIRLADSGVPEGVIDVMVAVSHPEYFVVTPDGMPSDVRDRVVEHAYRSGAPIGFRAFLWDPFFAPSYWYGYSPFGYYGYRYGGYYGYWPGSIIVVPRDPSYTAPAGGRMYRDGGYRPRPSSGGSSSGGGGAARSSGSSDSGGSSGSSDSSGSSRGSSGGGRTAVPRGSR